jgi:hypothetical protein
MRRAISLVLALALIASGLGLIFIEFGGDAPRKLWLAGPFLLAIGLGWLYEDFSS